MAPRGHRILTATGDALDRFGVSDSSTILLGLSGGADSAALLHVLLELRSRRRFRLVAAHLNHQIRGAESDRDEAFVRELCARLGVDLICERAGGLYAAMANLEERAREVRHEFLERAARAAAADFIALAHHADDQAETVMMRLLRGAGASGLAAMAGEGPGKIIRPMLSVSRAEIVSFIGDRQIEFVADSSNSSRAMLRNRIRHDLLPMLEREYSPGLAGRLTELAGEMRELDEMISPLAARELDKLRVGTNALDVSQFGGLPKALQRCVVRLMIERVAGSLRGVSREHIESVRYLATEAGPSAAVDLPGLRARRDYSLLKLERDDARPFSAYSLPLALDGCTRLDEAGFVFHSRIEAAGESRMPSSLYEAVFDAAAVEPCGLVARSFSPGDLIAPFGIAGHRKLKEIFIDRKVSRDARARWPVVTLRDEITWLPGLVRSRTALVTASTEKVLRIAARTHPEF